MRVVLYCQPLTGLGHYVRTLEIARELARAHETHLATAAPAFPGARDAPQVRFVDLPRLWREDGALRGDGDLDAVLAARSALLRDTVARVRPDALLVEHFPFSKWELAAEAIAAIDAARAAGGKIVCSLRDIALKSRYDTSGLDVVATLEERFDLLLVHGDPRVLRLEEHVPWARGIRIPRAYTGYVARRLLGTVAEARGRIVVSAGGGREAEALVAGCLAAHARGATGGRPMVVFPGPFAPDVAAPAGVEMRRFAADLAGWMAAADLSISRAGYNTCADLLVARARALLVPSSVMSDQRLRARRFAELGLAETVEPPAQLADAIQRALARPRPEHAVALDGARRTRSLVEALVAGAEVSGLE